MITKSVKKSLNFRIHWLEKKFCEPLETKSPSGNIELYKLYMGQLLLLRTSPLKGLCTER